MAKGKKSNPLRVLLAPKSIFIPMGIGLSVAGFLLWRNFDREAFSAIEWDWHSTFWIMVAFLMVFLRDFAYMYRIKTLTNKEFSWRQSVQTILLWEFASAATPSVVGGAPIAIFILNKEGVNLGRSTTIVLLTSLLDELFFIVMVPFMYLLLWNQDMFLTHHQESIVSFSSGTKAVFVVSYSLIFLYSILISYGLFFNPKGFKNILTFIFGLPLLNKWKDFGEKTGNEIVEASKDIKGMPKSYWIKACVSTFVSWTARYWVVNFIILAFVFTDQHLLIYGRQLVMWVIMLISPTPGGSGLAEFAFSVYLKEFIPHGLESTLAFLWRLLSYYPYLIIGAVILPVWVRNVYLKRKLIKFKS